MFEPMDTPSTREEFERRLYLLRERLRQGKMHFSSSVVRTLDGLLRVRALPNGRIDFLSIDESTRLQANMMNQFDGRDFGEQPAQEDDGGSTS